MKLFFATLFVALGAIAAQSVDESITVNDPLEINLVDIKVSPVLPSAIV